jgi:hypothetical protein
MAGARPCFPCPLRRDIASSLPRPLQLLGIPRPVAHPGGTAIFARRHRLPRPHRRASHHGAAAQPSQDLRPRHRRREDARGPGRAAAIARPGRTGADPTDTAVPAGTRPAGRRKIRYRSAAARPRVASSAAGAVRDSIASVLLPSGTHCRRAALPAAVRPSGDPAYHNRTGLPRRAPPLPVAASCRRQSPRPSGLGYRVVPRLDPDASPPPTAGPHWRTW